MLDRNTRECRPFRMCIWLMSCQWFLNFLLHLKNSVMLLEQRSKTACDWWGGQMIQDKCLPQNAAHRGLLDQEMHTCQCLPQRDVSWIIKIRKKKKKPCDIKGMSVWSSQNLTAIRHTHFYIIVPSSTRASLVTQMVKNVLAAQETGVWALDQEDPLGKKMAIHSSVLENSMDRGAWQVTVHWVSKSQTQPRD